MNPEYREWLRRAIRSGALARALGGSGRTGRDRDLSGLLADCDAAIRSETAVGRITLEAVMYRLDLDRFTTRRVLDDLGVPHGVYVDAVHLRSALREKVPETKRQNACK